MPFTSENNKLYSTNKDMTTFKSTHLRNIPSKIRDSMELYNPSDPIFELPYQNMQTQEHQETEDFFDYNNDDDEEFNYHDHDDSDFNDDDGIDFEEDELEHELPPTPFWFGYEDKEQIKAIFKEYTKALKLDEEAKKRIREPPPFIGRIKRVKIFHELKFMTLDTVDIFTRSFLAPGSAMPLKKTVHTLTSWSIEEGLPETISIVTKESEIDSLLQKEQLDVPISYILSFPIYGSRNQEFTYLVSEENKEVTYSPESLHTKILYAIPIERKNVEEQSLEE